MEMVSTPNIFSLVKGAGEGRMLLNAFDQALLNAGVGDTNLMRMSSIVPPGAVEREKIALPPGGLIPVAYAHIDSDQPGEIISAAIAVALPEDPALPGVIMEYEARAPLTVVEAKVRQMAEDAFAYRNRSLKEIKSLGVEHTVSECGAVFAGAVLWYE
ncbi:arginine decarboxylase, pyruvoyl-dependent [Balneolales bacterium ANBcel1]|nr:arginine decarboxylase, pyruvoyl-dependent [Balneolales bacterium ANBcel1]